MMQGHQSSPHAISGRTIGLLAVALAVAWTIVLPLLRPVLPVDETRYLTVAWEMHRDLNFIVPRLNGEIYAHKPPLLFWLINLIWSVTGPSEVAARMVAPAFGVLSVALTWRLGNRLFPNRTNLGATAALILASTGIFALYGSLTMFDTMLTTATLLGILALLRMDAVGRWPATFAFGAALAFGVLAKGPVILVHLLPLALAQPIWSLSEKPSGAGSWYRRVGAGFIVALALLAVWLVPALWLGGPEYRDEILWRQSAGRMVNAFDHARPFWFFVVILPVLLWPWAWRPSALRGLWMGELWQDHRSRILGIWGIATLVLFSMISGKQAHYLLPALPAAALALAAAPAPRRGVGPIIACLAVIVPVFIWAGLLANGQAKIDGVAVMTLGPTTFVLAGVVAVAGFAMIVLAGRHSPILSWALVAPLALLVTQIILRPPMFELYDTENFATELSRAPAAGVAIVGFRYQGEFGFTARLSDRIVVLSEAELSSWVASHPGGLLVTTGDQPNIPPSVVEGWLAGNLLRLHRLP